MIKIISALKAIQLWKVATTIICSCDGVKEYVNGHEIPNTKVSIGYVYVHGLDIVDARARAERVIRDVYEENFLRIDFTNTYKVDKIEKFGEGFFGLEKKLN